MKFIDCIFIKDKNTIYEKINLYFYCIIRHLCGIL